MSRRAAGGGHVVLNIGGDATAPLPWPTHMDEDVTERESSISSEEDAGSGSDSEQRIHSRPVQDIWDPNDVWAGLQALPAAPDVIEGCAKGDLPRACLENAKHSVTGVLISSWLGDDKSLLVFIDSGAKANVTDDCGRSALHLAAYSGSIECVKLLLQHGADIRALDEIKRITPLHCAASSGKLLNVRTLIQAGADVNAGLTGRSPLHYAVQSEALACIEELLKAGANPNTPQVFTETPLHVAAGRGSAASIRLLLEYGAAVSVQYGPEKTTALHLAAEDGNAECARLLLEAGSNINARNKRSQTPLHLAALAQSAETLELLISRGANPDAADADGRTPLHSAIVKVSRCCECVRHLLAAGGNVNKPDCFGYTPLHIAALNEFSNCVLLLLNHNGDVTARTNGGVSALSFIVRRTPDVLPRYLTKFDQAIKLNDHDIGDVDCELKLDFRILVPCVGKGETELLLTFIEVGQREFLKHPLCETFLFLKWKRIRKFFLFSLIYHTIFVLLFTSYIVGVFLRDCPRQTKIAAYNCKVPYYVIIMSYFLFALTLLLLAKELFQLAHGLQNYIRHWENWLQWLIIISVPLCAVSPKHHTDISKEVWNWQHHVAAIAIFLTWLELMVIVGRFPMFGLYVQMFQTVAINFSKFLIAYSCLLIGFGLSFGVLFTNYPPFQNLIWGLIKTVIMMSGELEFEDIFYGDSQTLYPVTAHLMFLAFVLLVTVILTNLMVGLAVSDIQGLQQSAGLDRLVRQAELVAHLESMLFSKLLWCVPQKILDFCHTSALLLSSHYHWALYIRPNDPRENRAPKELIKSIYDLVVERKDRPKSKRIRAVLAPKLTPKNNASVRSTVGGIAGPEQTSKASDVSILPMYRRLSSNSSSHEPTVAALKAQISQLSAEVQHCQILFQQKLDSLIEQISNMNKKPTLNT